MSDINIHISEYLDYYYSLEYSPEYAVFLKGNWGVGKTWFIKQSLNKLEENESNYLYVSLYGVTTFEEIETDFYKQLHPLLSSKSFSLVGKIAKGLLKATIKVDLDNDGTSEGSVTTQTPDIDLPDYLTNTEDYILVFDDIERCSISINNLLGYINHFVEHQGHKVILIANENEIITKDTPENKQYLRIKEKLIGKEFEVEPDFYDALSYFISKNSKTELKDIYNINIDAIYELFNNSGYKNLRHLRISLLDFERIYDKISIESKGKEGLISHLLKVFLCYSFEIKSGNITANDLAFAESDPFGWRFDNEKSDKDKTPYDIIKEKYNNLDLFDTLLEESVWVDIFKKGLVDDKKVEESLLQSIYYQDENTPNWVNLWHYYNLSDDQFEKYFHLVNTEFNEFHYEEVGVVKHVVGILLTLSNLQLVDVNKKDILTHSKAYIDELKNKGLLNKDKSINTDFIHTSAWNGLGFSGKDIPEYELFLSYLEKQTKEVITESYIDIAGELLTLIKEDTKLFYRRITINNHEDNLYYNIPILSYINIDLFIEKFMEVGTPQKRTVIHAFVNRYEMPLDTLAPELEWLLGVKESLECEQEKLNGKISGFQLKELIDNSLTKAIELLKGRISHVAQIKKHINSST